MPASKRKVSMGTLYREMALMESILVWFDENATEAQLAKLHKHIDHVMGSDMEPAKAEKYYTRLADKAGWNALGEAKHREWVKQFNLKHNNKENSK